MSENNKPLILTIGLESQTEQLVVVKGDHCETIIKPFSDEIVENCLNPEIDLIFCGPPPDGVPPIEVGQSLRMNYPNAHIYFLTTQRSTFNRRVLKKNGFTDALLIPSDQSFFSEVFRKEISRITEGKIKAFRPIQLSDLTADAVLGFDLYLNLPANNKKVKYVSGTEILGTERAAKLNKHQVQTALVSEDEMGKFYEFTARQKKRELGEFKSETEKKERRDDAVRELLSGIFSESSKEDSINRGREILAECQNLISLFILDPNTSKANAMEKLLSVPLSESTVYIHAGNTATFAALLSISFGIGDPQELALAGLLHNIGIADLPAEIVLKPESMRTPEEDAKYKQHPMLSIRMLQERKMIIPEKVVEMIQQHREKFNGKGYPLGLPGPKIMKEAQILSIAVELDEMCATKPGKPLVSIAEAIEKIWSEGLASPTSSAFDPPTLRLLKSITKKAS